MDVDGNGTIEFPEFLELMKMKAKEVNDEYLNECKIKSFNFVCELMKMMPALT